LQLLEKVFQVPSFRDTWNTFIGKTLPDYFWQQSVAVLSHCLQHWSALSQPAHLVESQHSFLSQSAQHSVAAFSVFFELLQQLHDAAANIAATIAIAINTFFIIVTFNRFDFILPRRI
jgi:hypothetical protein